MTVRGAVWCDVVVISAMTIFMINKVPSIIRLGVSGEERGMAGETAGRKKVVKGAAARIWSSGRRG